MDTKARIAATIVVVSATVLGVSTEPVEQLPVAIDDSPHFLLNGATLDEADRMQWAIDRFLDSGLDLPSLDIHFAQDCQERFGAWGSIQWGSTTPWRVEVCTTGVYLHELAHAWDRWNLTDADRRMYLDLRGLDAWQGRDLTWVQRGEEDLAWLVARILGRGVNRYRSKDTQTDLDHFELMTGISVPIVRTTDPTSPQSRSSLYKRSLAAGEPGMPARR